MKTAYEALKKAVNRTGFGPECRLLIKHLVQSAKKELSRCKRLQLTSKVAGKSYFSFSRGGRKSRPVNCELFDEQNGQALEVFLRILQGERRTFPSGDITRSIYTVAMTCCAGRDVAADGDQKTPGSIFEWLCAAVIQASLDVRPRRSLPVLNLDLKGDLPTDFVFDLGEEKPKFHLPVKTSTRERIIQVWAHQRVLDGVYGAGRFLALPIILTETKLDAKKLEVVEICLPWQWRLYQMHIASLWNVCYLDAPAAYLELDKSFPRIGVATIGDVLKKDGRLDVLLSTHGLLENTCPTASQIQ